MITEAHAQSVVRLQGAALGWQLWRNNVGVAQTADGRPVRYGLANDSHALNERLKSSDLFGWRSLLIQPEHVGLVVAQVVSPECKRAGWTSDHALTPRETAQAAWCDLIRAAGGLAGFTTGEQPLDVALSRPYR